MYIYVCPGSPGWIYLALGEYLQTVIRVPDHDGGRPMEVNACILITHMVYL
jgi:hypothetical protein